MISPRIVNDTPSAKGARPSSGADIPPRDAPLATAASDAHTVAEFLSAGLAARHGARWLGGARRPALACASGSPLIRSFAERRLFQVGDAVPEALTAWADGRRRVVVLRSQPSPREMLRLQARGWRCVSLLPEGCDTGRHADVFDFAIHDLCHLEKFAAPEHHLAQVGFFALLDRALDDPRWEELERGLDAAWPPDRDYVLADMNGHAVYLFVALKRKLWLAVRRAFPSDEAAARRAHERLYDLLALDGAPRAAAAAIGAKGSLPDGLATLVARFEVVGRAALQEAGLGA